MTQEARLDFLIRYLLQERGETGKLSLPSTVLERRQLLRGLMNLRPPQPVSQDFLQVQDAYLQARAVEKGIQQKADLRPLRPGLYLWQGDITTLAVDGIVNAANSGMLGCFVPCHGCIDNAIHSFAGVQLRLECARLMAAQQGEEPTGRAKITKAYNLPSRYVLHTVGPIVYDHVTQTDRAQLESCYRACLELAAAKGLKSLAFCCISTGEFHFPNRLAAKTAVETVQAWQQAHPNQVEVIFNVFKELDRALYRELLTAD